MGIGTSQTKTAPTLGIFVSPSSVARARNFPGSKSSASRRTAGPSFPGRPAACWAHCFPNCLYHPVSGCRRPAPMQVWRSAPPAVAAALVPAWRSVLVSALEPAGLAVSTAAALVSAVLIAVPAGVPTIASAPVPITVPMPAPTIALWTVAEAQLPPARNSGEQKKTSRLPVAIRNILWPANV